MEKTISGLINYFRASRKRRALLLITLTVCLILVFAVYIRMLIMDLPSIYALEDYTPSLVTKLYDCNNELIGELFAERRSLVPLKDIPKDLQNAVMAMEDEQFYYHWGVSIKGVARAALNNLVKRRVSQGGSTITQQLAKVVFLSPERTVSRKFKEIILTLQLEYYFTKAEILQLYFNQIYFGAGSYGVKAAALTYFGKDIRGLNLPECALLAGFVRAPNYYSPFTNPKRALDRRAVVLRRMRELKLITAAQEKDANEYPINSERIAKEQPAASYFGEYIRLQLEPRYGSNMIYRGGLSVYTTLDIKMQIAAEKALDAGLTAFDKEREPFFETKHSSATRVQGALLALDPKTGGIRAMIGGRSFKDSQFNRTYQAKRQPGSVFKPIIYTSAMENGFTPASIINDSPLVYVNDGRDWRLASRTTDYLTTLPEDWLKDPMKVWTPANYKNKYFGNVTIRTALAKSLNSCSIQVLEKIGPMRAIDYARKLGISTPLTNTLSLALGSSDVILMEIVDAFAVFANSGIRTEPYSIVRVEDKDGRVLEEHAPKEEEVLSPQTCYVMTSLLEGVVQHGTGVYAKYYLGRPGAGKTGTTNEFTDAWFVGFTPQLAAGVWVGYDDVNIRLGNGNSGGKIACPIWTNFMHDAMKDKPLMTFQPPQEGVVFSLIDPETGLLALTKTKGAYLEAFIKGTEPKKYYYQMENETTAQPPVKPEKEPSLIAPSPETQPAQEEEKTPPPAKFNFELED